MRAWSRGSYTMSSGRPASKREYEQRMKLLEERDSCPDCKKIQDEQMERVVCGGERVRFCNRHQSI